MSYDLGFWYEESLITYSQAASRYAALIAGDVSVAKPHPSVARFFDDLISIYPDLTEDNLETSPWTSPIQRTSECVIVTIDYSRHKSVSTQLKSLARSHSLVCLDPQSETLYIFRGKRYPVLTRASGEILECPRRGEIADSIDDLSDDDWYVILEKGRSQFLQVGLGPVSGVPAYTYSLEYRDGVDSPLFRTTTHDIRVVKGVFDKYSRFEPEWQAGLDFVRLQH